jgi:glycogen synthase
MVNPNNIFMIGWEYPPHNSGGLGVACQGLTQALAEQGQRLYFTLPYQLPGNVPHMQLLNCQDPSWVDTPSLIGQPPFSVYGHHEGSSVLPYSDMEQRVNEYADQVVAAGQATSDFDVIHAHDWMAFPAAAALQDSTDRPIVAHIHSTEFDRIPDGVGSKYIMAAEQAGLQRAQRVIAVSHYTKQLIIQHYGIDAKKIDVVYNGIDPLPSAPTDETSHFAAGRPVIVFMGRLTMQKGAEYFLELANDVLKKLPTALFIVAGDGDQYRSLLLRTAQKGLSAHVLFTGFLRSPHRENLLDRADVFVMPSLSEPFGLVALEAAQRQTPVIISKNSGVAEVLPSAKVVDFWDINKMSSSIVSLVSDKTAHHEQVQSQSEDISKVTWQRAAHRVADSYMKVFRGHG